MTIFSTDRNDRASRSLSDASTFETVDTVSDSSDNKSIGTTHKQNILKRLVSRNKRGGEASKKNKTRGRRIMERFSRRVRSKSAKAEVKNFSPAQSVLIEEAPMNERVAADTKVAVESSTKAFDEEQSEASPSTPVVLEESVEVSFVSEKPAQKEEVPSATFTECHDSDTCIEIEEENQDQFVEEQPLLQKADFHNASSDYVGLAMVGFLVCLLASPILRG